MRKTPAREAGTWWMPQFQRKVVVAVQARPLMARAIQAVGLTCEKGGGASLAPIVGYDKAAEVAKESLKSGKTVRQVAAERKLLSPADLDKALDAKRMTSPQADMVGSGGG